jgi:flagellar FliL protein
MSKTTTPTTTAPNQNPVPASTAVGRRWLKGRKRVWLWSAAALLLVALTASLVLRMVQINQANSDVDEDDPANPSESEAKERIPPHYVALETMVVNLADPGGNRFVQLGITLVLTDKKAGADLQLMLPAIRSRLMLLVSQRYANDLLRIEGKHKLAADIRTETSKLLQHRPDDQGAPIERVLFSTLIVQ